MAPNRETKEAANTDVLPQTQQELQHLEGIQLYGILISLMIATFLISLDVSVIATVRVYSTSLGTHLTY
jgi:hypothetical protein